MIKENEEDKVEAQEEVELVEGMTTKTTVRDHAPGPLFLGC